MYKKGVSKCNFVILSVAKDLVGTVTESIARCFTFVQHDRMLPSPSSTLRHDHLLAATDIDAGTG